MKVLKLLLLVVLLLTIGGVIYIYSAPTVSTQAGAVAAPKPTAAAAPSGSVIIPVQGIRADQLTDTWHQARATDRVHEATDIMAPGGTPVLAAFNGRIEKLFTSKLGGLTVYQRSDDPAWQGYYAHLRGYAPGLAEGQHVTQGQTLGYVGDTGDAGLGNFHLHFALNRMSAGQGWWQGEAVNPYPILAGKASLR